MNYCTNCGAGRSAGSFCGECGQRHPTAPVLVEEHGDDVEDDEDDEGVSHDDRNGGFVIGAIVVGLILLLLFAITRPDIDETSPAYIKGQQVAATYIDSGQSIDKLKTPDEVCSIKTEADATDQVKTEATNNEAGCRAAFKAHLDAQT